MSTPLTFDAWVLTHFSSQPERDIYDLTRAAWSAASEACKVGIPAGWTILCTDRNEVLVQAPGCDPGATTISLRPGDSLPLRLLDALCRALIAAAPSQQPVPENCDVRKILLSVEPGDDGMGEEVYAKSVADVEAVLDKMGEELEDWQLGIKRLAAPTPGMAVQALAGEIIAALLADEKDGGYDLTAGLFGKKFSDLVRRWASVEYHAPATPPVRDATPVATVVLSRTPGKLKLELTREDALLDLPDGEHKLYAAPLEQIAELELSLEMRLQSCEQMSDVIAGLERQVAEVVACFRAAEVEGLPQTLAESTDNRLKDLVERRLMYALYACQRGAS